jgi:hypothetical protein
MTRRTLITREGRPLALSQPKPLPDGPDACTERVTARGPLGGCGEALPAARKHLGVCERCARDHTRRHNPDAPGIKPVPFGGPRLTEEQAREAADRGRQNRARPVKLELPLRSGRLMRVSEPEPSDRYGGERIVRAVCGCRDVVIVRVATWAGPRPPRGCRKCSRAVPDDMLPSRHHDVELLRNPDGTCTEVDEFGQRWVTVTCKRVLCGRQWKILRHRWSKSSHRPKACSRCSSSRAAKTVNMIGIASEKRTGTDR